MDLKAYYKKIREVETTINPPFVVLVGLDTAEGGKAGTTTEATRSLAARLITEGRARLGSPEETQGFYDRNAESRREAEASAAAQRMQVTIVGNTELKTRLSRASKD